MSRPTRSFGPADPRVKAADLVTVGDINEIEEKARGGPANTLL